MFQSDCEHSTLFVSIESKDVCSTNKTSQGQSLLSITFGSGSEQYSTKTPASFNFTTTHLQAFKSLIGPGMFGFVNVVPGFHVTWHAGALDHTLDDSGGYIYLIDVDESNVTLFNSTVNNLCIETRYEFSAYLANVIGKQYNFTNPNIRFEVRSAAPQNILLAQFITDVPDYDIMTWCQYSVSFNASTPSIVLLIISNLGGGMGNDIAIDDIELRVCSFAPFVSSPPGW